MDRYAILADLVTSAADCVGNQNNGCIYDTFVSPGEPPSDCSHIAAYWTSSQVLHGSQKCLIKVRESLVISLNRCCLKNNGEIFDAALEDDDARCFLQDFGAMIDCLICNSNDVISQYVRTCHDITVQSGEADQSVAGGCYGGSVHISFTRHHPCCA